MKYLSFFVFSIHFLFFTSLFAQTAITYEKDGIRNGVISNKNFDKEIVSARNYDIEKRKDTGYWMWTCKNGEGEDCQGYAETRRDAKDAGKENCGIIPKLKWVSKIAVKKGIYDLKF